MAEKKKNWWEDFTPNREAEVKQTARVAEQKKSATSNVQKWTQRTGSTQNLIKQYGASRANYQKWYGGNRPSAREAMAQATRLAGDDVAMQRKYEEMYANEVLSPDSDVYNPYVQATNTKAIDGLLSLGVDVPEVISDEWVDSMQRKYSPFARQTGTSYGPAAPTKSSTREENIAYWVNSLYDSKERTNLAEAQLGDLYSEVSYLVGQGYSDSEVMKRVRDSFDSKYNTLSKMDEERMARSALRLNRAVDYSGDDTVYGMIWAARNGGGTGSYFRDSIHYTLGDGNQYKRDPNSEAALDPTNYEGYDPYSRGGTLHDLQQKYGVNSFDKSWLDANRSSLVGTADGAKDFERIMSAVDNSEKAVAELAELDKWLENNVNKTVNGKPITAEALVAKLEALIDEDGTETVKFPTLKKMEAERYAGGALALSGAVAFTLPQYIEKAQAMVAERDAAAAQAAEEEKNSPTFGEKFTEGAKKVIGTVGRFLASMGIDGVGSFGESIDAALEAQDGAYDANTIGKNFASKELGIEIHGDLNAQELAAVEDMVAKVQAATQNYATPEQIQAANDSVAVVQNMLTMAGNDPARQNQETYENSGAWTSVVEGLEAEPREGMVDMVADQVSYTGEAPEAEPAADQENASMLEAYRGIMQGGAWDGNVIDWAFAHSSDNMLIVGEIVNGIKNHIQSGAELTGIAKSWWDRFGGIVDDLYQPATYDELDAYEMNPQAYDSRRAYGTQVFGALQMNAEAYSMGAIDGDTYAMNLFRISDVAEGISGMTDGARATDEQADRYLEVTGASSILEKVYNSCNEGMQLQRSLEAETNQQIYEANAEVIRQYEAGEPITDEAAFLSIMTTDTSELKANDPTYQQSSEFISRTLSFDGIADDGIAFTTGDAGMDASYGKDVVQAEGAALYSKGVTALAQSELETHMKFAAACGMSLEQFYQEFPTYARTPGQLVAEARTAYNGAWGEFGHTLEGLMAANDSILNAGAAVEGVPESEQNQDTLDISDLIALAFDKVNASNALNGDKTLYMMMHGFKDGEAERDILLTQHGSREGVAAEWDRIEAEREANLRNVYENDITARQSGMSYEDWRVENTDKALDELKAKRATAKDILDLGDPAKWSSQQAIVEKTGNVANIDKLVTENGSEFDKQVFDGVTGLMQTGQFMYQSIMLGGGYTASLAATLASSGGDAYDRFMESGDYDAAVAASIGAWLVNAAVETSLDRFVPESLGGNREMKMALARNNLAKMGVFSWMKDPKSMSKAARSIADLVIGGTMNAGGEGVEEALQSIVDSLADNVVYGNTILSGEQVGEAFQAGVSGMVMGAFLEGGSNMVFGKPAITDYAGNAISKAEADLLPETEGVVLSKAIEFEATAMAIANGQEALAQIEQSSENQELRNLVKDMQIVDAEIAEAENELQVAVDNRAAAAMALEAVDNERIDSDVFTEDMSKRMVTAATAIQDADQQIGKSRERAEAAKNRKAEMQQRHDELKTKVQGMYNQVMNEAKTHYAEVVTEKYFGSDAPEQQAAATAYLDACKELQDGKARLAEIKGEMNTYGTGTPRGDAARKAYGKALLELDNLADKVGKAKAEMDAAYAVSPEAKMEAVHNDALEQAKAAATQAMEASVADPTNVRKQLAADHAQAQLEAIQAQQELEGMREGISQRLNSPDSKTRDAAVADWKAAQQKASDAAATAQALEAEFNETDTQKQLKAAIENMKQYDNMDLMDERSENYEAANDAYTELQIARAAVDVEQAMAELASAMETPDQIDGISQAVRKVKDAQEKGRAYIGDGDTGRQVHIDDRGWEDTTDKAVKPFLNEHRNEFKDYALATAKAILADVQISEPGRRIFVWDGMGAGHGSDILVLGQTRGTSSILAEYMDRTKWSWRSMETYLGRFIDALENDKPLQNLAYIKRIEMMIDQALSEGYVGAHGDKIPPSYDYLKAKGAIDGRSYGDIAYELEDGGTFYDIYGIGSPVTPKFIERVIEASKNIAIDDRTTPTGEHILEIGNKFVYTDGNTVSPRISKVVTFMYKGWEPEIDAVIREGLYDIEGREDPDRVREQNFATISDILGAGDAFRTYYMGNAEEGKGGTGSGTGSNDSSNGARSRKQVPAEEGNIQAWRNTGDGFGDHRGPARTGEATTADRNPIEILSDLTSRIHIGYNPGGSMNEGNRRLPRAVQGFYNRHAQSITSRTNAAGDLEIGLHEFGHAVQQRLPNLHANQQLLNGLSQGVRNAYDQRELDSEAIAEFVVDYIFSRDEAVRQAGAQFVQDFEDMMANDRDLYDAVMEASHQTELWNNADVGSKMDAMIKEGNDPRRGQIGNGLQRLARNIETAVADLTAPADLVSRDFRRSALYSMHASRRADVSLTRFLIDPQGRNIGQSLAERFYRAGVTEGDQAAVSRYALARHALDRRAQNKDVFSEAEFPTADLEAYIADVEANHPNIVAGADALTSFWNDFMDAWWVGTGMIDADDVATMRAMYPHYVPTFRVVGENFNQYGGKSSRFQMRGAVRGGSSLEVIDPIASIVKMTQQMTSTVTQNQLMREFHNEWRRGGLGEIADDVTQQYRVQRTNTDALQTTLDAINATGTVDPALMGDAYAEMLNLQERWYGTGQNYGANVVSGVDENGNRFFYRIKEGAEGLYNLLSGTAGRNGDMGAILNTVRNFKNAFTKLTTGSNPLFALKNLQRDIQASVNTGTHSLFYADGMYHWLRAFHEVLTGSDTYREWQAMGGGEHTRFNTELNGREAGAVVRELGRDLMRGRMNRRGDFKTRNTALENISNVLTWEQLNNAIENASRYVEYRFGRHDLGTDAGRREAFMASQDVTTNFGTHGASGTIKVLNQVVPFMNATIQGLNKDVNIIRDVFSGDANRRRQAAPKAAKTLMNTALTAALQYALLKMFGGNEDDEDYALLSQDMRTGNLIIPIGKGAMEELGDVVGFDKPYIRIPIAQGPLAQGMYAKALDLMADVANYSPMEVDLWKAAKSILSDSVPDGTVFQAISDAKNNRTWYGGEIESEYMRNYSVTNRYDSDTPRAIIELGQVLNVSPAKLDYLLNQYSGFAGKIIMPLLSTGRLNGEGGLDERAKNLAYNVLKNYTIDPVSSNDLSSSYTAAKTTISQILADGKAGKPMGDLAYSVDPEEAYDAAQYLSKEFNALDKEIAALWAEYNAIKDSDLSDGDKARQMRDIRRNYIVPLQQDAMALYEEYKMQYIDNDWLAMAITGDIPWSLDRPTLD